MKKYVADFETTTDPLDCRVWAYGICQINNVQNVSYGNSLDDFMNLTMKENTLIYFHNLKFDGAFILDWLFVNGYRYSEKKETKTFSTIISKMGQFYQIEVIHERKNRKYKKTVFNDSLKKLPFSVKVIAEAFKLNILKGELDYHTYRPVGHILTDEEILYIKNDVQIVATALGIQFEQGLLAMTTGKDALDDCIDVMGKKVFDANFPILPLDVDEEIRDAYKGGFTYLNPKYKSVDVKKGIVFDVNSLYPYVMYECNLPYDRPLLFNGKYIPDEIYPLYIQQFECEFELKKDHIPTLQIKNLSFIPTEYLTSSEGDSVNLLMSNVDLELFLKHYDVTGIEYISGWKFKSCQGVFKEYIDKWMKIKIENTGAIRLLAKLMLNSLYGKFATNPDVTGMYPVYKNNVVKFKEKEPEFRNPVYTPMGVFITAYARSKTITAAQLEYDRFIYADTDSLHLVGDTLPSSIDIDGNALGKWKHESTFSRANFIRAKTYIEVIDNELHVVCAGMPDEVKRNVTIESFKYGFSAKRLRPQRVKGGIVLVDAPFTIK